MPATRPRLRRRNLLFFLAGESLARDWLYTKARGGGVIREREHCRCWTRLAGERGGAIPYHLAYYTQGANCRNPGPVQEGREKEKTSPAWIILAAAKGGGGRFPLFDTWLQYPRGGGGGGKRKKREKRVLMAWETHFFHVGINFLCCMIIRVSTSNERLLVVVVGEEEAVPSWASNGGCWFKAVHIFWRQSNFVFLFPVGNSAMVLVPGFMSANPRHTMQTMTEIQASECCSINIL